MGKRDKRVAWVNPIAAARASGPKEITGTTIRDYLDRDRPTIEEVTERIKKAREGSHSLANWEEQQQKKFSHELAAQRERVLGESSSSKGLKKRKKKEKKKSSKKRHRERSRSPVNDHSQSSDKDLEEVKKKKKRHRKKQETSSDSEDRTHSDDLATQTARSPITFSTSRDILYKQFVNVPPYISNAMNNKPPIPPKHKKRKRKHNDSDSSCSS